MIKVTKVRPGEGPRLMLQFSDGTTGDYDCSSLLAMSGPMAQPLKDPNYFNRVFVEMGAPTWPNGFDLAPSAIHKELAATGLLRRSESSAAE